MKLIVVYVFWCEYMYYSKKQIDLKKKLLDGIFYNHDKKNIIN